MSKSSTINQNQFNTFLSFLKTTQNSDRNRLMFLFGYYCGMRVGEISNLTYSHVLNNDGSIKNEISLKPNQTKSNRNIVYYVSDKMKFEIESYINKRREKIEYSDYLFQPTNRNKKFTPNSLTHIFKQLFSRCGLDSVSSHGLRRSFITNLHNKGVGVKVIMELVNHKHLSTTQNYIDVTEDVKRETVNLL